MSSLFTAAHNRTKKLQQLQANDEKPQEKTKKDKMMETLNNYFKKKTDSSSDSFAVGDFFRKLQSTPTLSLQEMKKLVESELS
jgi:hypothetical protein